MKLVNYALIIAIARNASFLYLYRSYLRLSISNIIDGVSFELCAYNL